MADKLFDFGIDPHTGLRCAGYEEDGQVVIVNQQQGNAVKEILDHNAACAQQYREHMVRFGSNGGYLASIPPLTHHRWRKEWQAGPRKYGIPWNGPNNSFLARKLRDPANKNLRFAKI